MAPEGCLPRQPRKIPRLCKWPAKAVVPIRPVMTPGPDPMPPFDAPHHAIQGSGWYAQLKSGSGRRSTGIQQYCPRITRDGPASIRLGEEQHHQNCGRRHNGVHSSAKTSSRQAEKVLPRRPVPPFRFQPRKGPAQCSLSHAAPADSHSQKIENAQPIAATMGYSGWRVQKTHCPCRKCRTGFSRGGVMPSRESRESPED